MPAQFYPEDERRARSRFSVEKTQEQTHKTTQGGGKGKKKNSRIKYIVIAAILLLIVLAVLILAMWARSGVEEDPYDDVENMYSASRYFCRIKYPNKWELVPGDNGFYIDSEKGLFLTAYPYNEQDVEYENEEGVIAPAGATPEPIKVPVEGVLVSAYYKEIEDFEWPEATAETDPTPAPYDIEEAGAKAVELIEGKGATEISKSEKFVGKHCSFLRYKYTPGEGKEGEMFVCSRAMAYYIFTYEATTELFKTYETAALSMVNNVELSVFKY